MNEANRKEIGRRVGNKLQLLAKRGRPAGAVDSILRSWLAPSDTG